MKYLAPKWCRANITKIKRKEKIKNKCFMINMRIKVPIKQTLYNYKMLNNKKKQKTKQTNKQTNQQTNKQKENNLSFLLTLRGEGWWCGGRTSYLLKEVIEYEVSQ